MAKNDNAIRLQILAAMIAYLLLRLARRLNPLRMPGLALRRAGLPNACSCDSPIAEIDKTSTGQSSKPKPRFSLDQLGFSYA